MKWGVVLTFIAMATTMFVGLFFTPAIIKLLGKEQYGLYNLIRSFVGYFYLFEFGLSAAIIRYVAKYTAEKNTLKRDQLISLSLWVFLLIDVVIILMALVTMYNLPIFFPKLTVQELEEARLMLYYLFGSIIISIISNVFLGALSGSSLFIFPRVVALFTEFIRIAGIIAILYFKLDAIALVALGSVVSVFSAIINIYYAIYKLKIKLYYTFWDSALFQKIAKYSFYIFLGMLMGSIYWELDIYIISRMIDTTAIAVYAVAMQLNGIFKMTTTAITSVILPRATALVVTNESEEGTTTFLAQVGRFILYIYLLMSLGFFFFGKLFIRLWLGEDFIAVWYIALVVVLGAFVPRVQGGINDLVKAKNKHKFLAFLYFFMALVNVFLTIIFIKKWGLNGAVYATVSGLILGNVLVANYYYSKYMHVQIASFFQKTFQNTYIPFLLMLVLGYLMNHYLAFYSWLAFVLEIMLYTLVYIVIFWNFAFSAKEKQFFKSFLND